MAGPYVRPRHCRAASLLALTVLTGACGLIEPQSDPAQQATVTVQGTSPVPLELITASNFTLAFNQETGVTDSNLLVADTAALSPPFEQVYDVSSLERFLVRVTNADSMVASLRLQVFLDGILEYDQQANISDGGSLEYSFQFNRLQ